MERYEVIVNARLVSVWAANAEDALEQAQAMADAVDRVKARS